MRVVVEAAAFDPGALLNAFTADTTGAGAVVSFTGVMRDEAGQVEAMQIEHYPAMTAPAIAAMVREAEQRWPLQNVWVVHRFGDLHPGEVIMMVATAARHRADAFAAADFLMDYLKSRAPFWKKERRANGAAWVEAKASDAAALARWQTESAVPPLSPVPKPR